MQDIRPIGRFPVQAGRTAAAKSFEQGRFLLHLLLKAPDMRKIRLS